ncbi:MAG TPA: flagellar hook-basal body complex protein FliE [Candidatus Baltobacteraceae bacterium]|jgi:flagellar hook-basal body complex protein FliE|nr:flagellar hook-basal body complex protein FliE [Candidatus Baltobacteraceae bacterium]
MNVRPLDPSELDFPPSGFRNAAPTDFTDSPNSASSTETGDFGSFLNEAIRSTGDALTHADRAESSFAAGKGGLAEMVFERAQADVMLAVATSAASHMAQNVQTLLNMQV